MAHRLLRPFRGGMTRLLQQPKPTISLTPNSCRNYISEMRKEAFEGNILRLLRNEIQYELDHSPPTKVPLCYCLVKDMPHMRTTTELHIFGPIPEFNLFVVDERPGEQWIRLKKKYVENEEIKVDVTMFDASVPAKKPGGVVTEDDVQLHITMVVNVSKEGSDVLELVCSAWPDTIEIRHVFTCGHDTNHPYMGPKFKELDDQLQDALYDFLEVRGINDELAVFLHKYTRNKDKTEFIRWMDTVKSFIEKKQKR